MDRVVANDSAEGLRPRGYITSQQTDFRYRKRAHVKISGSLVEELDIFDLGRVGERITEHRW